MADTSLVQSLKLEVMGFTGLGKDALHVYLGLAVWLLASALFRRSIATLRPWLAVLVVALVIETFDAFDNWRDFGHWRWRASIHDVINTMFWPTVLALLARFTIFRRSRATTENGVEATPTVNVEEEKRRSPRP